MLKLLKRGYVGKPGKLSMKDASYDIRVFKRISHLHYHGVSRGMNETTAIRIVRLVEDTLV